MGTCTECFCFNNPGLTKQEVTDKALSYTKKAREEQITAFALAIITIVLFAIAFTLFGISALPHETTMGLGFIPYIGGLFLSAIGIGVFLGALAHFAIASVHNCQEERLLKQSS